MSFKPTNETSTLYQQSLKYHLCDMDIDTVFVLKCFDIEMPLNIENYYIIDITDNPQAFLKSKGELYAIKILPIEINEGNIKIGLIDYILQLDNSR